VLADDIERIEDALGGHEWRLTEDQTLEARQARRLLW